MKSRYPTVLRALMLVGALIPLMACDDDPVEPPAPVAANIAVTGSGQTGPAGRMLSQPLTIRVTAADGTPIVGQQIRARVTGGGGTIAPETGATGTDGTASAVWTLGQVAGSAQTVLVEALSAAGAVILSAEAVATATAGAAATIEITPSSLTPFLSSGRTAQLSAVVKDAFGNTAPGAVTWQSADTLVATVSSTGLVTTRLKNGVAVIIARAGTAAATVNVSLERIPANVQVTRPPNIGSIRVGETVQFTAAATDSAGQAVAAGVTWLSLTPSRASIDATGRLLALANGWAVFEAHVTAGVKRDSVFIGPDAAIAIAIVSPTATTVTNDTVLVSVNVATTHTLQSVTATFAGVTKPLTQGPPGTWSAPFSTAGLAAGATTTLLVEARAAQGFFNTATRDVVVDRPVTLSITAPVANATYTTIIPVNVTCAAGTVACTSLTVETSFGVTLTGTASVAGNIVAPGGQHTVRVTGVSATGRVQTINVPVTVVLPAQPIVTWQIESGNNQSGLAGSFLASDVVMRALDQSGAGLANMPATVTAHAGSVEVPATTDATGRLRIRWRLGNVAAVQKLTISAVGTGGLVSTDVFAVALAGAATQVTVLSGSGQIVAANELVPQPLRVTVTDAVGNPVSNATVTWQVQSGGGSITASSQTGDDGIAIAQWRVGTVGPQTARATISNGANVTFTATAGAAAVPTSIEMTPDSLRFYTRSRPQSTVTVVRDQYGHAMAATVAWHSTNPAVASVDPAGNVQANTEDGTAWIVAVSGALRDSIPARVQRYPGLFELRAVLNNRQVMPVGDSVLVIVDVAADSSGYPLTNAVFTFTSRDPAVAIGSASGWVRGLSDGETVIDVGIQGSTAMLQRIVRVGPDQAIEITVGTECVRDGQTLRCFTTDPATELVPVTVNYPLSSVASISVTIGPRQGTSTGGAVSVSTSDLAAGEYPMYVRVTMQNGRYNEVRGVAIISP